MVDESIEVRKVVAPAGAAGVDERAGRVELYTREPMVNWLGPLQLARTALRTAVATTLGAFADPREVQAALMPLASNPPLEVPAGGAGTDDGVWIDYLADTGDGWDSTYSMALCVSQPVTLDQAPPRTLPAGRVLLLGGDQVYPTPARNGYRTRFLDPFRAASPAPVSDAATSDPEAPIAIPDAPWMLATPGNHDWYDGLRGFAQLFCNGKPVGRWVTKQRTSYYALKVRPGWWVWGLDLQLESAIDRPQRDYFNAMHKALLPGDRVVVCTPEPSWVDEAERVEREGRKALPSIETLTPRFRSLREIEVLLGEHLVLVLAGDSHHYARFAPRAGSGAPQRITCGGGGAFVHGTHALPDPPKPITVAGIKQHYTLAAIYPDKPTSERLRDHAWRLPTRNLSFCGVLAVLYLLWIWMVQSASKVPSPMRGGRSVMEVLADLPPSLGNACETWRQLFWAVAHSPSSVVYMLAIVGGCGALSASGVKRATGFAFFAGAVHGLLHFGLAVGLLWLMGRVNLHHLGLDADDLRQVGVFVIETLVLGSTLGGLLFGVWMVLTNRAWGLHAEEVFSSQRIEDYKCFLRMHFEDDRLTIYPLKLERVCRGWTLGRGAKVLTHVKRTWRLRVQPGDHGPRFAPAHGEPVPARSLHLIEPPIEIPRTPSNRAPS
ncbi:MULTISPECIES: preprotein translocase subunit YajC [Cupriavidus]|nr:preprotein translocase subunit YajC [Cupriavidus pauculus]